MSGLDGVLWDKWLSVRNERNGYLQWKLTIQLIALYYIELTLSIPLQS
jgi:hypothetical protein